MYTEPKNIPSQGKASPNRPENGANTPPPNSERAEPPALEMPSISLPKGGGSIRGIEEKFQVNAVNGTASFGIPLPLSPARLSPEIGLGYNSGGGNSSFGLGWQLGIPSIARKTEKGLPTYQDRTESDTFILSGAEDLVRRLEKNGNDWVRTTMPRSDGGTAYTVSAYRPRIEGMFARIERWENNTTKDTHWRTISKDNIHSYYGLTDESRIADPQDASRVFEWLLCKTHDDKGSTCLYQYKKEDFTGVSKALNEANRAGSCTQTYLKKALYGNKSPYYLGDNEPAENDFMFRVVFDYGEHDSSPEIPKDIDQEKNPWTCRQDPFSTYRAGFEIRTYRRCNRVLVFHCFDELPHSPYLTKSLQVFYDDTLDLIGNQQQINGFSYLVKARQNGHLWDEATQRYETKFLPETDIQYQPHEWNTYIQTVSPESISNAPSGLSDRRYLWIDLFNEGISGILTEQAGAWFYKSNLGSAEFSAALPVANTPSFRGLGQRLSFQELEGNGIKYLVQLDEEPKGFFRFSEDEVWTPMQPFESLPLGAADNMRTLDLNSDGKTDLLISEENSFLWYKGLGEKGFELGQRVLKEIDEEKGPAILFEDRQQSIFLTDMSGDGLTDIVRIRNGEICYWPNLGYGRFGAKVGMDNAPLFDSPDAFNPAYLRLADIDGSGTTDVVYLGKNDFRVWLNLNGNEWTTDPQIINPFPTIHSLADVAVLDFLGSGTACIVYSSPIASEPLQYIDLMGSKKPHVFNGYQNNCGREVAIEYQPSTYYYLNDKAEGKKWITQLPFPVHFISKVRSEDKVRNTVFTSTYSYSHGYYDFVEREFRGFARVEQLDTEDFGHFKLNESKNVVEEQFHQPPVRAVSWFHTGAFLNGKRILNQCREEYFQNTDFAEYSIPEPVLPEGLTNEEIVEALRACKGLSLRIEVYADDDSDKSPFPYSAAQSAYEIRLVQPRGANRFASFLVVPSESISYGYDRNPADPHVSQFFVLETDELGNATQSASVVYPRVARPAHTPDKVWEEQNKMHISYGEAFFTGDIDTDEVYRLRAGFESKSYEIGGVNQPAGFFFQKQELKNSLDAASQILFEEEFDGNVQKRLLAQARTYFMNDGFTGARLLGDLSPLGIGHSSQQLAFTKNLVSNYYGAKVTDQMLTDARYVHSEGDEHWWVPSGEYLFDDDPESNFYTPIGSRDLFGNESRVEYDVYTALVQRTTDALGNSASATHDYRTLSPVMMTDANLNRAAVEMDALGMVIKSAVMGKEGSNDGDTLADPTVRLEYDLFNWQNNGKPNFVHTFAREQHGAANPRWQEGYTYSDGGGGVIMAKSQTSPGLARQWNALTQQVEGVPADPRWIGNGRTIVNNKGNVIKQFEPYFSTTHEFESEDALVETGMTPLLYYDPIGRNIRTELPNGTFTKVEFDGWSFQSFDANDTVTESQWYADRGSPDPLAAEPNDPEQRAAWLAARHDNTPATAYVDSLSRSFYAITDYGNGKTSTAYSETDLAGRYSRVYDQLGRLVSEAYVNLLGQTMYGKSAEKGENWVFTDAMGRLVKLWDNDVREFRTTYDALHRPVSTFFSEGGVETLFGRVVYGDLFSDAEATVRNMKGCAYQVYDQGGVVTITTVDFKGNAVAAERRLTQEYKQTINWDVLDGLNDIAAIQVAAEPLLESEIFVSTATVDALGRPITVTLPDSSVVQPAYDEGNGLASLNVQLRGAGAFVNFLESQEYDAKGQRQEARFGNGTITRYFYDPQTFRLTNLITTPTMAAGDNEAFQNLHYTFDPTGNITQIRDDAQQTHYFNNAVVSPESKFEYDAVYQLTKATGREHAGLGGNSQRSEQDLPFLNQLPHQNDATAVRTYTENYEYDLLGNIKRLQHFATNANWDQRYQYAYETNPADTTNRLRAISAPGDAEGAFSTNGYAYDFHGNMTQMPHLAQMAWNFMDQLQQVDLGGGGNAYYTYGTGGNRLRKVVERIGGKRLERIYLGAVEIYRERQGNGAPTLERHTLHISDNTGKIAQVDTKTIDTNNSDPVNLLNQNTIRYQYGNHLGSACLETDETGQVISYEEYHPFGTSAYRVGHPGKDLSLKRYRFSGKERDDETGLYYFGARYYAAWLGRWTSSDPAGFVSGFNLYRYCANNPVMFHDPNGMQEVVSIPAPESIQDEIDPVVVSRKLRELGLDFTGFNPDGSPTEPDASGRGHGLVKDIDGTWQVGRWLQDMTPPTDDSLEITATYSPRVSQETSPPPAKKDTPPPAASVPDSLTHGGPGLEKYIWEGRNFRDRGFTLEHLYNNDFKDAYEAKGDNRPKYDVETDTHVKQIKSSKGNTKTLKSHASKATRDAGAAIKNKATQSMSGKSPQAVVITPTDTHTSAADDILEGYSKIRKPVPNSVPPEHVRGLPGTVGKVGRGLTYLGTGLSAYALVDDLSRGDYSMATGDSLSLAGGSLEIYAIAVPGATVAGASAMTVGLAVGGIGIAVTSGISGYRSYEEGDTAGAIAGAVGVGAGLAVTTGAGIMLASAAGVAVGAGAVAAAPVILAVGLVAAAGVGIFHVGRYFDWW